MWPGSAASSYQIEPTVSVSLPLSFVSCTVATSFATGYDWCWPRYPGILLRHASAARSRERGRAASSEADWQLWAGASLAAGPLRTVPPTVAAGPQHVAGSPLPTFKRAAAQQHPSQAAELTADSD